MKEGKFAKKEKKEEKKKNPVLLSEKLDCAT